MGKTHLKFKKWAFYVTVKLLDELYYFSMTISLKNASI